MFAERSLNYAALYALCVYNLCLAGPVQAQPYDIGQLVEFLRSPDSTRVRQAAYTLAALREGAAPAIPQLEQITQHAEPEVREVASYALGQIGTPAQSSIPTLTKTLQGDMDSKVRRAAAEALSHVETLPGPALKALSDATRDSNNEVKRAVIFTLAEFGVDAAPAVPDLIQALADPVPEVRRVATYALGRIGPEAKSAVTALAATMQDEVANVRENAAYALGRIGIGAQSDAGACQCAAG
jgi:HEAT repeat protein